MSWRTTRKLTIVAIIFAFFLICVAGAYYRYKPLPTCFDGKKNNTETGIDCGGGCAKVCPDQVKNLRTVWARFMMINKGEYTIVALMENPNLNLGSPKASYTVQLLNRGGTVIGERTGTTFINPNEKFVVFEPNFTVGSDTPTRAFISFASIDNWQKPAVDKAVLTVVRRDFSTTTAPTLRVSLNNTSVYDLAEVLVPVVISDQAGNAISASATFVDNLTAGASREVNFTWREPFTAPPVFVDFYPRANNFLLH